MSNLDELRSAYEAADAEAIRLSNEHQTQLQDAVRGLKEKYHDPIWEANRNAAAAQKAYCDAEALEVLKTRSDGRDVAASLVKQGGLTQGQVDEAFAAGEE